MFVVAADGGRARNLTQLDVQRLFPDFRATAAGFTSVGGYRRATTGRYRCPAARQWRSRRRRAVRLESWDGSSVFYVESTSTNSSGPLWRLTLKGGDAVKLADNVLSNSFDVIDAGVYYLEAAPGDVRLQFYNFFHPAFDNRDVEAWESGSGHRRVARRPHDLLFACGFGNENI